MVIESETLLLIPAAQPVVDLQDTPTPSQALPPPHQDRGDNSWTTTLLIVISRAG